MAFYYRKVSVTDGQNLDIKINQAGKKPSYILLYSFVHNDKHLKTNLLYVLLICKLNNFLYILTHVKLTIFSKLEHLHCHIFIVFVVKFDFLKGKILTMTLWPEA